VGEASWREVMRCRLPEHRGAKRWAVHRLGAS
jgi:hypothetical protein